MNRQHLVMLWCAICVLALASCTSHRKLAKPDTASTASMAWKARCEITVQRNGHDPIRTTGSVRFMHDEVMQLIVTPIMGMEMARVEFSPNDVLVIDRMNKQYIRSSYGELNDMAGTKLSYDALQRRFLKELALPDQAGNVTREIDFQLNDKLSVHCRVYDFVQTTDWVLHTEVSDKYQAVRAVDLLNLMPRP